MIVVEILFHSFLFHVDPGNVHYLFSEAFKILTLFSFVEPLASLVFRFFYTFRVLRVIFGLHFIEIVRALIGASMKNEASNALDGRNNLLNEFK